MVQALIGFVLLGLFITVGFFAANMLLFAVVYVFMLVFTLPYMAIKFVFQKLMEWRAQDVTSK